MVTQLVIYSVFVYNCDTPKLFETFECKSKNGNNERMS